jgi:type III secretion system low calcium response chaperone LcrH/SycD
MDKEALEALKLAGGRFHDYVMAGHTLGPLLGSSVESQEALYRLAYRLYGQAKYAEAQRLFAILLMHNHLDRRYYLAYGACAQMLKRHPDALRYYSVAAQLDLTDPQPAIHMAECLLALGQRGEARACLDHGLIQARHHEEHRHHVPRLEALLSLLERAGPGQGEAPAGGAPVTDTKEA